MTDHITLPRSTVKLAPKRIRVDRHCPRCKHHGYHDGNYMGRKNIISCSNCSHEWKGRITKDEQS